MSFFDYRDGVLCAEGVALPAIADAVGTPVHVYSASALRHAANAFASALQGLPSARFAFAVKANPNGAVLRLLAECRHPFPKSMAKQERTRCGRVARHLICQQA